MGISRWSQWVDNYVNTNDVYETKNGNVGIGTTLTTTAALTVMNGNVGTSAHGSRWCLYKLLALAPRLQMAGV